MDGIKPRTTWVWVWVCLCECVYVWLHVLNKYLPLLKFETKFLVHSIIS